MTEARVVLPKTVPVSQAAAILKILPQKIHKWIRDGDLETHINPRNNKREVVVDEVKKLNEGSTGKRGRPAKELGSTLVDGVNVSDILVRMETQEVIRTVHTICGESEGFYALRSSKDPRGFKDTWKKEDVKGMMAQDRAFLIDRWAFLHILADSFDITEEGHIAESLRAIASAEKEKSDERKAIFIDEQRGRMIEAEERLKLEAAAKKEAREKGKTEGEGDW